MHHISLCFKLHKLNTNKEAPPNKNFKESDQPTKTLSALTKNNNSLLQTAKIKAISLNGHIERINVLFDGGSQVSFITDSLCSKLGLRLHPSPNLSYNSFGTDKNVYTTTNKTTVKLSFQKNGTIILPVLTINKIGGYFQQTCTPNMGKNLFGLNLDNANINGNVDLLLGCDNYWSCVTGEIKNHFPGPVAMNSIFGWLISGKNKFLQTPRSFQVMMLHNAEDMMFDFDDSSNKFLELHSNFSPTELLTSSEDPTFSTFCSTITESNNRYSADLPWRSGLMVTNNNYFLARNRLNSVITSLKKNDILTQYNEIINTYLKKDYIEICNRSDKEFFLPHHAVIKQDRVTTKIRIVFDGSSRTNQSLSLNDCLYKGPTLLNDLAVMLIKFRIGTIAVTSDLVLEKLQKKPFFKLKYKTKTEII